MRSRFAVAAIAVAALLIPANGYAQGRMRVGLIGGLTLGSVTQPQATRRVAPLVGGFASVDLGGRAALETGLRRVSRGFKVNEVDFEARLEVDYLEIPVALSVRPQIGEKVTPFAAAGLAVDLKLRCRWSLVRQGERLSSRCLEDPGELDAEIRGADLGATLEGGFEVGRFRLGLAFYIGLTPIGNGPATVKHRGVNLAAVYSIPVGR